MRSERFSVPKNQVVALTCYQQGHLGDRDYITAIVTQGVLGGQFTLFLPDASGQFHKAATSRCPDFEQIL